MDPGSRAVGRKEKRNWSVNQFTGVLREMAESVANRMQTITLFEEPFPNVQCCEATLDNVWRDMECDHVQDHLRDVKIDSYTSLDVRSQELEAVTEGPV